MANLEGTNLCDFHLMTTFASLSLQYKRLRNKNDVFSGSNCWKGLERFICEMSRCFVIFVKSTSTAVNNCPGLFSVVISAQFQFSTFPENCFQFPCFVFSESVIRYKVRSTKYEETAHLHTNCTKQNKTLTWAYQRFHMECVIIYHARGLLNIFNISRRTAPYQQCLGCERMHFLRITLAVKW